MENENIIFDIHEEFEKREKETSSDKIIESIDCELDRLRELKRSYERIMGE